MWAALLTTFDLNVFMYSRHDVSSAHRLVQQTCVQASVDAHVSGMTQCVCFLGGAVQPRLNLNIIKQ